MRGGFLHIAQRHPGIKRGGDERMPKCMGRNRFEDPGAARHPPHDPSGAMSVQPPSVRCHEDRAVGPFAGGQVYRGRCAARAG